MSKIFEPKLDILEGNIKENQIQVVCNQASPNYDYCVGELYFSAVSAVVIDEAVKFGRESKYPRPEDALKHMYAVEYKNLPDKGWR